MADEKSYLLRVEAVNLGNFITDSDDLSTIRGAGLLLLNAGRFLCGRSDVKEELASRAGLFQTADGAKWTYDGRSGADGNKTSMTKPPLKGSNDARSGADGNKVFETNTVMLRSNDARSGADGQGGRGIGPVHRAWPRQRFSARR